MFCRELILPTIVCFVFMLAGGGLALSQLVGIWKVRDYVKTQAIVVKVDTWYNEDGGQMATATYRYTVNGIEYEKRSSYGQSASISPMVGDTKTIYYNPRNPEIVEDGRWISWLLCGVGVLFLGVGAGVWIYIVKTTNR